MRNNLRSQTSFTSNLSKRRAEFRLALVTQHTKNILFIKTSEWQQAVFLLALGAICLIHVGVLYEDGST